MAQFHRVDTSKLVRGAGRLLYAPITQTKPAKISDVIELAAVTAASEVQLVTITGTPSGGTFTLTFDGQTTAAIVYNATAAQVQSALEALPNIDVGDVTASGGPLPGTAVTLTFAGKYALRDVPQATATGAFTGGATPAVTVTTTTAGTSQYGAKAGWQELGATREGIQISINNTEDSFEIDQISGPVATAPNSWTCTLATRLAEFTMENLVFALEGAPITEDTTTTPPERETGFAGATSYTHRRMTVLFQKPNGKISAYCFHDMTRAPQEGQLNFQRTGDPMTIAIQMAANADATEADQRKQFFRVREQV